MECNTSLKHFVNLGNSIASAFPLIGRVGVTGVTRHGLSKRLCFSVPHRR